MQFKIPQNVQVEDKIVGPLTLKHLIILGIGGGMDYFLYISLSNTYILEVWLLPVAIIGLLTLAIAFLKIKGISFIHYVFLALEYYFTPRKRVWSQGAGNVFLSITQPRPKTKDEKAKAKQEKKAPKNLNNIENLTAILDTHSELMGEKHDALQEIIQNH